MKLLRRVFMNSSLYGSLVVLILWQILNIALESSIVPGPYETIVTFFRLIREDLLLHVATSLFRISAAVVISMAVGVPLGLWTGLGKWADALISPIVYILYPIPKIAFLPVFMILFGLGNTAKIILIITIILFQITLAARDGVREIPQELYYSVHSLGLNRWQTYMDMVLPAVLPKLFSALRVSIGISIAALFFGENFATSYGIGYFIMNSWIMVDYVQMFAGILAISIMGILIFKLIDLVERKLCPWIFLHEVSEQL